MYDVILATDSFQSFAGEVGLQIALAVGVTVGSLAALLGLGFGVRLTYRTIFNYPGGVGYNPSYGSGTSRFKKTNYSEGTGGHMKSYTF